MGKYVKRRGQLDQMTVNNINYPYSLAHNNYILMGTNGPYTEEDHQPWHASVF